MDAEKRWYPIRVSVELFVVAFACQPMAVPGKDSA